MKFIYDDRALMLKNITSNELEKINKSTKILIAYDILKIEWYTVKIASTEHNYIAVKDAINHQKYH